MNKLALVVGLFCLAAGASATTIFYGGDMDGVNGLANEFNTIVSDAQVFIDFDVPPGNNTITELWSNNLTNLTGVTTAHYAIFQGMSTGNPGVPIQSGVLSGSNVTWKPTGRSAFGFQEWTVWGSIPPVTVAPGRYFMSIAPDGLGQQGRSFMSTTVGLNSIGTPINNGNSFFNSVFFGAFYQPVSGQLGYDADFSGGVNAIPEPASLSLLALGALTLIRRR